MNWSTGLFPGPGLWGLEAIQQDRVQAAAPSGKIVFLIRVSYVQDLVWSTPSSF